MIQRVATHYSVAAARGIEQASILLCDPRFYETRRRKRNNWKQKMADQQAAQELERAERRLCPTAEQIAEQIAWAERGLAYHRGEAERYQESLDQWRGVTPRNFRLIPKPGQPKTTVD